ncbi:tigger transposable element-derived protein 6-like [Schistocerca cancellata]|uniref:tigger transposable element-derived protein 6-like n=1 Tax=Schistocerca cancellata TaxID=274614 RepID=UPI002118AA8B|nr:tigger transposable element-derived protein 6-like [Schistocerca cancellata]
MARKNKKIALLEDNCNAHNNMLPLKNVELRYFPLNCTLILQPLDMGILRTSRQNTLQSSSTNDWKHCKVSGHSCSFNVKQACDMIASSQNSVELKVIANCWKKARISENEKVGEKVVVDEKMEGDVQSDLERYSSIIGKTIGVSIVEYMSLDDEALVFKAHTNESIIKELKGNLPVEDADDDSHVISENPPPLMELIGQLEAIQQVASSVPCVSAKQLAALKEIKTIFIYKRIIKKNETNESI